jgi:hypothetical protein
MADLSEADVNEIMVAVANALERELNGDGSLDFGFLLLIRHAKVRPDGATAIGGISNMAPDDVSAVLAEYDIARIDPAEWSPINPPTAIVRPPS